MLLRDRGNIWYDAGVTRDAQLAKTHRSGEVHVWRVMLEAGPEVLSACRDRLSAGERERADRLWGEAQGRRWTVAHGALRTILGSYTGIEPRRLEFALGPQGKPQLATGEDGVEFNLSHSGHLALVAISGAACVGVDVELLQPEIECDGLSGEFFAPEEVQALRALPPDVRREAFFACWTRKEAYVKAVGAGWASSDGFAVTRSRNSAAWRWPPLRLGEPKRRRPGTSCTNCIRAERTAGEVASYRPAVFAGR